MGKVIFCTGERAEKPYIFPSTGVRVYTIEELCYYLEQILDTLCEDSIDREMADFIRGELKLTERADLLEHLILIRAPLRDRLAVVFCSADYYNEDDINRILNELAKMADMSLTGRRKRKADRYMMEGCFSEAMQEYRSIIASKESAELSDEEYGSILHNIGVLFVKTGAFNIAAESFYEAYRRNDRKESLKQYLYSLKLGHRDEFYNEEMMRLVDNSSIHEEMEHEMEFVKQRLEQSIEMEEITRLKLLWQQDRYSEFDRKVEEIVRNLKYKYRNDNR